MNHSSERSKTNVSSSSKGFRERYQTPTRKNRINFARFLLAELESDQRWAELFSRPDSEDLLERLADEAIVAHRAGRTQLLKRI